MLKKIWNEDFRTVFVFGLYQNLFEKKINLQNPINWQNIQISLIEEEILEEGTDLNPAELDSNITYYQDSKDQIIEIIEPHLTKKFSTLFDIIKAILISFVIEFQQLQSSDVEFGDKTKSQLFTKYLTLAEEYTMIANVKLVHAILAKIMNLEVADAEVEGEDIIDEDINQNS
jgi:transcription termination factor NusB